LNSDIKVSYIELEFALGCYQTQSRTILLDKGLLKYPRLHDAVLKHELRHSRVTSKPIGTFETMGVDVLALEIMPDHIHLFVGAKPTDTPYKIVKQLKGNTSIQIRRCFPDLRYLGCKQHFGKGFDSLWAIGYYCGSAGHVSQEAVKRYIQEQEGKDVFEYSVFGSPQQKIGNFTQTKLRVF